MTFFTFSDYIASTITGDRKPAYIKLPTDEFYETLKYLAPYMDARWHAATEEARPRVPEGSDMFVMRGIPIVLDNTASLPEPVYA